MRSRLSTAFGLAACLALSPLTHGQDPGAAQPTTKAQERDLAAQREIAKAVQSLDALLAQLADAQARAQEAVDRVRMATGKTEEADLERATRIARNLQQELDALLTTVTTSIQRLTELRQRAADEVPAGLVDTSEPLRTRIADTAKLANLADTETELLRIEKELSADAGNTPGAAQMLGFARYRLADTWRLQSIVELRKKRNDREAEKFMGRAVDKFAEVLTGPDCDSTGEGSSMHAAALRRTAQIEVVLYDFYKQKSQLQPGSTGIATTARKHKDALEAAMNKLQRTYGDATLPDGSSMFEAAGREVDRRIK